MTRFRSVPALALMLMLSSSAFAAEPTLPELFNRAKGEFASGDHKTSLASFEQLDRNSSAPGLENDRTKLVPVITFYRAANLAALGRKDEARDMFLTYLGYMPAAAITSPPYSKQIVAAFEAARKESNSKAATLMVAYERFTVPAGWTLPADAAWSSTPVRYLLTPSQKKEYESLSTDSVRADFADRFWGQLDPTPGTPANELRAEFERRIAFADATFTEAKKRGSDTDRGAAFAVLGPPTYAGITVLAQSDEAIGQLRESGNSEVLKGSGVRVDRKAPRDNPARVDTRRPTLETDAQRGKRESWYYRQPRIPAGVPYKEVRMEFLTKPGYGTGVLQKDPEPLKMIAQAAENARATRKLN